MLPVKSFVMPTTFTVGLVLKRPEPIQAHTPQQPILRYEHEPLVIAFPYADIFLALNH